MNQQNNEFIFTSKRLGYRLIVGYVFLPEFWGKNLATEALIALLEWAKKHIQTVNTIIAFTPVDHIASQRVMQKANMIYYKNDIKDNVECVFYIYELR